MAYGMGPDAAIRIYGLELAGIADPITFIETGDGLSYAIRQWRRSPRRLRHHRT